MSTAVAEPDPSILHKVFIGLCTAGAMALIVKVIAFGKDLAVAGQFGTSGLMDAFFIAYLVPALASYLFSSVPDAVIPIYARLRAEEEPRTVDAFVSHTLWLYSAVLAAGLGLGYLVSEPLVGLLGRKLDPAHQALALQLFRLLLPFVFFDSLCQIWANLLRSHRQFAFPAISPATIPLCVLASLLLFGSRWGVYSLALGTLAGSFLQAALLASRCRRVCGHRLTRFDPSKTGPTLRAGQVALPLMAGEALYATSAFVDGAMASRLGEGSISTFTYAEKVFSIVLMLATTAVAEVVFPYLSDFAARRQWRELKQFFLRFCSILCAAAIAASTVMALLAPWIVQLLFERGAFTPDDTVRVAAVLRFCTPQLPFVVIGVVANRVLVSMGKGNILLAMTGITCVCNILCNLLFIRFFGLPGIALSTAVVYLVSASIMTWAVLRVLGAKMDPPGS